MEKALYFVIGFVIGGALSFTAMFALWRWAMASLPQFSGLKGDYSDQFGDRPIVNPKVPPS